MSPVKTTTKQMMLHNVQKFGKKAGRKTSWSPVSGWVLVCSQELPGAVTVTHTGVRGG